MSTELVSIKLTDDIHKSVDKGNMVGAIFIDLTKAFDLTSLAKLLTKPPQYGVKEIELDWFKDYLFHHTVRLAYNNHVSQECDLLVGVPQSSILGPLYYF